MGGDVQNTIFHGSRATLAFKLSDIDGGNLIPVGWATGVSWNEATNCEEFQPIGELGVAENIELNYRVTLRATVARFSDLSLRKIGLQPKYTEILTRGEMLCIVADKINGKTVTITGVKFKSAPQDLRSGTMNYSDIEFYARRVIYEDEV